MKANFILKSSSHYEEDQPEEHCSICGCELEWEDCPDCGGTGFFDEYEDDPINCIPGEDITECSLCDGEGGFFCCPNAENHRREFAQQGGQAELLSCTRCGENEAYEGGLCWDCLDG